MTLNLPSKADRKRSVIPISFRSLSWASAQLPRHRAQGSTPNIKRHMSKASLDNLNGKVVGGGPIGMTLIQAARDGLLELVRTHLEMSTAQIHDVDEDGFTALHHTARYNRVRVLEALVEGGGDINIKGGQDEMRPLHMACRYNSGSVTQYLLAQGAIVNIRDIKGRTPLHYATRRGHDVVTKMLLSAASCDVNAADNDLTTPLTMAAIQGNIDVCELLISRGADIQKKDVNDMTPLMWAASDVKIVRLLLKAATRHGTAFAHQYVKLADNEGNTALHLAVQNGAIDVCELLLNNSADVNCHKHNLATPLHVAATQGFAELAKLLIYHGADVNSRDCEQMTPIHKAATYNKVHIIDLLMSHGGNINAKDKKNMSPLHCASWKGQTDAVDYLLKEGAQLAEADSSLKTALHWTVQFGHYETLLSLLKNGGRYLLECSDKNDQTVLHYASYTGNVSVMKTLLDYSARTDAKDQEERTPLHIAAQYDNVSCVEALIAVSNHETNDDDVDGRTPLLLACIHGHHQVVQILLSLGADVSKRDDEHCSALMLAAARGHVTVMKILLDNHASVNDTDKMKNTALHYACSGGHTEAAQLLLDKRANVVLKNTHEHTPLDLAIDNLHRDVATVLLRHKSWRDSMGVRDCEGKTALDKLIAKLPDVAAILLDHCVERTSRDDEDPNLTMAFDYQYLDPGPQDPASSRNRYFALITMINYERDKLLAHPLCQNLLSQKWVRFGRFTFYMNLIVYIGYLVSLTSYVQAVEGQAMIRTDLVDFRGCPIYLNETERQNASLVAHYVKYGKMTDEELYQKDVKSIVCAIFVVIFGFFVFVREIFKLFSQKIRYFTNFFHWMAWVLVIATIVFLHPIDQLPCLRQWRAGWFALFLAWINFIMYLRRIDFVGIYVIMFVTVLVSLLKAVVVFFLFVWAFAGSFSIIMAAKEKRHGTEEGSAPPVYTNIWTSAINIVVMTLGEIEYVDNFLPINNLEPFAFDANILLLIFLFLMPIVLMNLMIGIAVGDIEKVQHSAYLKRIGLQVDLLYNIENNMPKFMQRKVHVRRAIVKPNRNTTSLWHQLKRCVLGSSMSVQFIQADVIDKTTETLGRVQEELHQQRQRVRQLQVTLQQQTTLLQQIGSKLEVCSGPGIHAADQVSAEVANAVACESADQISGQVSVYDNFEAMQRTRSVRVAIDANDRPKSMII